MQRGNTCKPTRFGLIDKNTVAAYDNDYFVPSFLNPDGEIKEVNARPSNDIGTGNNIQNPQFASSLS